MNTKFNIGDTVRLVEADYAEDVGATAVVKKIHIYWLQAENRVVETYGLHPETRVGRSNDSFSLVPPENMELVRITPVQPEGKQVFVILKTSHRTAFTWEKFTGTESEAAQKCREIANRDRDIIKVMLMPYQDMFHAERTILQEFNPNNY